MRDKSGRIIQVIAGTYTQKGYLLLYRWNFYLLRRLGDWLAKYSSEASAKEWADTDWPMPLPGDKGRMLYRVQEGTL